MIEKHPDRGASPLNRIEDMEIEKTEDSAERTTKERWQERNRGYPSHRSFRMTVFCILQSQFTVFSSETDSTDSGIRATVAQDFLGPSRKWITQERERGNMDELEPGHERTSPRGVWTRGEPWVIQRRETFSRLALRMIHF